MGELQRTDSEEPTLGALVRRFVRREPSMRFYQAAQLALPWAGFLAVVGAWRAAGVAAAIGGLGVYGVSTHALEERDLHGWRNSGAKLARATGALLGAGSLGFVLFELFFRLLGSAPTF